MRSPKKGQKDNIIYNSKLVVSNILKKDYEYFENGIKNVTNDWAQEVGNPIHILDLLLNNIDVSVQTVEILVGLLKLEFETA